MSKIKSEGKCVFCEKNYSGSGISRHLQTHLKGLPKAENKRSFHLKVDASPFFLHLLVDGNTSLGTLDDFLRKIWLECCGHLSQFSFGSWNEEIGKGTPARKVFSKGSTLWYAYDFGSTTELDLKCLNEYPTATPEGIRLLSRNEPLQLMCHTCEKETATQMCTVHWSMDGGHLFCEVCAEKHQEECDDAADYAMAFLYNSPRSGVCAYEGGSIDLERDEIA